MRDGLIGRKVKVKCCEAEKHGDNRACVCSLIGQTVVLERKSKTAGIAELPLYCIRGSDKRLRRSELRLLPKRRAN